MMRLRRQLVRWRADFFAGLAAVLPVVLSLAIFRWLFSAVSSVTDPLLAPFEYFLPAELIRDPRGNGDILWYWSLMALLLTVALIAAIGRLARNFVGRKMIEFIDALMTRVPLLNKVYVTIKQVNEAFSSSKRSAFKRVVLVEYPRPGSYSMAFLTSENHPEASAKVGRPVVGVFLPTTPNPTSGYLLIIPAADIIYLDMSVAEGIKLIISLGSVVPDYPTGQPALPGSPVAVDPRLAVPTSAPAPAAHDN